MQTIEEIVGRVLCLISQNTAKIADAQYEAYKQNKYGEPYNSQMKSIFTWIRIRSAEALTSPNAYIRRLAEIIVKENL